VIVRREGRMQLLCKGADSTVYERLGSDSADMMELTTSNLSVCITLSLERLCIAFNRSYLLDTVVSPSAVCLWRSVLWLNDTYYSKSLNEWIGTAAMDTVVHCVSKKTRQLWNGIAQNYNNRFWWSLAEIFRRLQNRVCMFQVLCRFAFLSTFCLSNRTPKKTRILTLYQANAPTFTRCIF